ncbi:hypothetical protein [Dokdonia sp. Hel_I_53]|uniref:hypothetical protein n=1 Tax=Dokdonia sp. Hel_I_53 TaxID=1566287 RepID=UPI00119B20B6|nr:hypothetical protein [Dokdonia sp. Hel_I_53]TVZ53363.1 hypothetical protein OD90_2569 [Dokdonia sp. Hel_I_53]
MNLNQLHIILLLLCSGSLVAQNKFYVLSKRATHNEAYATNDQSFDDFEAGWLFTENEGESTRSQSSIQLAIDYRMGYNDDPGYGCNGPCGQFSYYCDPSSPFPSDTADLDYNQNITLNSFKRITYDGPADLGPYDVGDTCLPVNYVAVYIPQSMTPTGAVCDSEPLFNFYSGNSINIPYLTWQYERDNGQWQNLPNNRNRYPLDRSITEIFGANYENSFTGNLKVRYRIQAQFSSTIYTSDIYTITVAPKTPGIQTLTEIDTSCVYTSDGSFLILFDSSINGDQLQFNLREGSPSGPLFTDVETINGTTYSWPAPLTPNNYYLTYQKLPNGCARTFGPITIGNPPAFAYEITANEINCFNDNDGTITITIDPNNLGDSPYYYIINGSSPIGFSSATTTIQNLTPNSYNIQVYDQNDCTQRQ